MHRAVLLLEGLTLLLVASGCPAPAGLAPNVTLLRRPATRSHLRVLLASPPSGTLVAAGFDGVIVRSTDLGVTWRPVPGGRGRRLYGGAVTKRGEFYLVGEDGTILHSEDHGGSFWPEPRLTPDRFIAAEVSPSGRLVVGGDGGMIAEGPAPFRLVREAEPGVSGLRTVARTGEGDLMIAMGYDGLVLRELSPSHWSRETGPGVDAIYGLASGPGGTLFGVGSFGTMVESPDGGRNFSIKPSGTHAFLRSIEFSDDDGISVGLGTIVVSHDGGNSWRSILRRYPAQLLDGSFVGDGVVVVVGEYGTILRSSNGGESFDESAEAFPLACIAWPAPTRVYAAGRGGRLLVSDDAGRSFRSRSIPTVEPIRSLAFWNAREGLLASPHGLFLTRDGGETFSRSLTKVRLSIRAVACLPGDVALVNGEETDFVSTDRGRTWKRRESRRRPTIRWLARGGGRAAAFGCGAGGLLTFCKKPGGAWLSPYTGIDSALNAVAASGEQLYAVGDAGRILVSRRLGFGSSLTLRQLPGSPRLTAVAVSTIDPRLAVVVGDLGVAYTKDGGRTFFELPLQDAEGLAGVAMRGRTALACGESGSIYRIDL